MKNLELGCMTALSAIYVCVVLLVVYRNELSGFGLDPTFWPWNLFLAGYIILIGICAPIRLLLSWFLSKRSLVEFFWVWMLVVVSLLGLVAVRDFFQSEGNNRGQAVSEPAWSNFDCNGELPLCYLPTGQIQIARLPSGKFILPKFADFTLLIAKFGSWFTGPRTFGMILPDLKPHWHGRPFQNGHNRGELHSVH